MRQKRKPRNVSKPQSPSHNGQRDRPRTGIDNPLVMENSQRQASEQLHRLMLQRVRSDIEVSHVGLSTLGQSTPQKMSTTNPLAEQEVKGASEEATERENPQDPAMNVEENSIDSLVESKITALRNELHSLQVRNEEKLNEEHNRDIIRANYLVENLSQMAELITELGKLEFISVPELADDISSFKAKIMADYTVYKTELSDLWQNTWLYERYQEHPWVKRFIISSNDDLEDMACPDIQVGDLISARASSAENQAKEKQSEKELASVVDEEDEISVIAELLRKPVEMLPGLSLRRSGGSDREELTIVDKPDVPRLMVSSESATDWRDRLFDSEKGAEGRSDLSIKAIGGGNELSGACYMVEFKHYQKYILIDAGLRLRDSDGRYPKLDDLPRPDLIIITHAHIDRCGALPYIVQKWPNTPIWCHRDALPMITLTLRQLQRQPLEKQAVAPEMSLYSAAEIEAVDLIARDFGQSYALFNSDLSVTLWPAGHCIGAASISLVGEKDSIFFTGEFATHDEPTVAAANWPKQNFDVVVANCSSPGNLVFDREAMRETLIEKVRETLENKGWAVFPIAEIGRAQDIYQLLVEATQKGLLPETPLYWDGTQKEIVDIYETHLLNAGEGYRNSYKQHLGKLLNDETRVALQNGPGVLFANPGFLQDVSGGSLLSRLLLDSNSTVFMPKVSDSLLDLRPLLRSIRGELSIQSYSWPAQPSEEELITQLKQLSPQAVLLVYGTTETQNDLRSALPTGIVKRTLATNQVMSVRPQKE